MTMMWSISPWRPATAKGRTMGRSARIGGTAFIVVAAIGLAVHHIIDQIDRRGGGAERRNRSQTSGPGGGIVQQPRKDERREDER